mmetsp:Transcript_52648/g.104538  ORF Transcript_52648/g.104538 Transcript_52648/m.104538 type:complete len:157 (+) Transcript_52648:46-516(+)
MALKFYGISVPISIVLATVYFYWITREKPGKKRAGQFKDMDVVVHKKPSSCSVKAGRGDLVHVHYTGYLKSTGKIYETSREQNDPYVFKLGTCNTKGKPECLKGFEKGVLGMCAGEKRKVTLPPQLAFGKTGRPPDVPPNDSIVFQIECIDVDSFK